MYGFSRELMSAPLSDVAVGVCRLTTASTAASTVALGAQATRAGRPLGVEQDDDGALVEPQVGSPLLGSGAGERGLDAGQRCRAGGSGTDAETGQLRNRPHRLV